MPAPSATHIAVPVTAKDGAVASSLYDGTTAPSTCSSCVESNSPWASGPIRIIIYSPEYLPVARPMSCTILLVDWAVVARAHNFFILNQ